MLCVLERERERERERVKGYGKKELSSVQPEAVWEGDTQLLTRWFENSSKRGSKGDVFLIQRCRSCVPLEPVTSWTEGSSPQFHNLPSFIPHFYDTPKFVHLNYIYWLCYETVFFFFWGFFIWINWLDSLFLYMHVGLFNLSIAMERCACIWEEEAKSNCFWA